MRCEACCEAVAELGADSPRLDDAVREHLATCPDCTQVTQALGRVDEDLARLERHDASDELVDQVLEAVAADDGVTVEEDPPSLDGAGRAPGVGWGARYLLPALGIATAATVILAIAEQVRVGELSHEAAYKNLPMAAATPPPPSGVPRPEDGESSRVDMPARESGRLVGVDADFARRAGSGLSSVGPSQAQPKPASIAEGQSGGRAANVSARPNRYVRTAPKEITVSSEAPIVDFSGSASAIEGGYAQEELKQRRRQGDPAPRNAKDELSWTGRRGAAEEEAGKARRRPGEKGDSRQRELGQLVLDQRQLQQDMADVYRAGEALAEKKKSVAVGSLDNKRRSRARAPRRWGDRRRRGRRIRPAPSDRRRHRPAGDRRPCRRSGASTPSRRNPPE